MTISNKHRPTSDLEFDLDTQMSRLKFEWRRGYEASIIARAEYQALAANRTANAESLDGARERLDRAEALKQRIMVKIERLEDDMLSRD
jgi:hypothetical protein